MARPHDLSQDPPATTPQAIEPRGAAMRIAGALLLELCLWAVLVMAFLGAYARAQSVGAETAWAHAGVVGTAWLLLGAVRLGLARICPHPAWRRWTGAIACALALLALTAYYALVLVGLQAWGRVLTWDLVRAYAGQVPALAAIAGVPAWLALGGPLLALALVAALLAACWMPRDGVAALAARLPARWFAYAFLGVAGLAAARLFAFATWPPVQLREPVSLTFFPVSGLPRAGTGGSAGSARADASIDAGYRPASDAVRRNVVLIVGDALRADHMGIYGYQRATTPFLDAAAQAGRLQVVPPLSAACSESLCGLLAIGRSRYVHEFGTAGLSLGEVLQRHGYEVHLLLSGDHTNYYGLRDTYGQVTSYFDGTMPGGRYPNDDGLVLERVRAMAPWNGRPQLLQVHLMSAHTLGLRRPEANIWTPAAYFFARPIARDPDPLPEVVNFYDNGVRELDRRIGELLAELAGKGYLGNALVVITADHGEMLGEHGVLGHSNSVRHGALRIPFLLMRHGYERASDFDQVVAGTQVDIAPTILHELHIPVPPGWSGQPLQARPFRRSFAFFQQGAAVGLLDYRHPPRVLKFWRDLKAGTEHAFDLAMDPGERIDIAGSLPDAMKHEWRSLLLPSEFVARTCCIRPD